VIRLFASKKRQVCAVLAAPTAKEMAQQVREALRDTSTMEVRLDWLRNDRERSEFLAWLQKNRRRSTLFLATCRRVPGGGKFKGGIPAQLRWLSRARQAGCSWCDVEVETFRALSNKNLRQYALPRHALLSVHDFKKTPYLTRQILHASRGSFDALKIAAHAKTIADSVRLLALAKNSRNFIAVAMGEAGLPARILALREGSALAYAPVREATAAGQVSLHEMMHLYRAQNITRHTRVYGVIGDPIGHSLSPLLHNTGFIALRLDAVYLPFLVQQLADFLGAIEPLGIRGFSVTLPHKQAIMKHLQECEPLAAEIGAVNTVVVRGDRSLYGCNTDYVGVLKALETKISLLRSRVLIFGAGGAARAAAFALSRAGAAVAICARRKKLAKSLAKAVHCEVIPRSALRTESFDAILNATPVGMHPHSAISPLTARELHCRIVMDLIYRPQRTKLLEIAERQGIATVSGLEMFLAQGLAQWELWTGKLAPQAPMRKAVAASLRAEELRGGAQRRSRA
jgi:3-dehydroquinate dehydratase/shikimate dehydrogenase